MKKKTTGLLMKEFREHIPFTAIASALAIIFVFILSIYFPMSDSKIAFESLHFAHVLFSAIATSAIFFKHNKGFVKGILISALGAIIIGTFSDVIFPFAGAFLFGIKASLHLPIIETPIIILASAIFGSWIGSITKKGIISHSIHVFLSIFASLFYFVSFASLSGMFDWLIAFLIVFVTVWIPCCFSDIWFPMLFAKKE